MQEMTQHFGTVMSLELTSRDDLGFTGAGSQFLNDALENVEVRRVGNDGDRFSSHNQSVDYAYLNQTGL